MVREQLQLLSSLPINSSIHKRSVKKRFWKDFNFAIKFFNFRFQPDY